MAKTLGTCCNKIIPPMLIVASLLSLQNCSRRQPPEVAQAPNQTAQLKPDLEHRQALLAVESVAANLDALQGGAGYQSWTAEKAAEQLIILLNSAQIPNPDSPKTLGPTFVYVANQVSAPWQGVIKVDGDALQVEAYGSNTLEPVEKRRIPVNRY